MKKTIQKVVLLFLVFAALTAAMILLGNAYGLFAPGAPAEGEPLTARHWLSALCWLLTGLLAALCVLQIGRIPFSAKGTPAAWKLAFGGAAFLAFTVGLVMGTAKLGVDINAVIIALGVVGACVAIGCEPLMYDLMGGLGVISGRDFEVGDIITVDGFRGQVTDITLRCVKLLDAGGNVRIIRNSELSSVVNLSSRESAAVVRIPYDPSEGKLAEFEKQLEACLDTLTEQNPEVFAKRPEYKGVDTWSSEGAELLVAASVPEEKVYQARRLMNRAFIRLKQEQ